jgi:hypothetical protein
VDRGASYEIFQLRLSDETSIVETAQAVITTKTPQMELNKHHREALISVLKATLIDRDTYKSLIAKSETAQDESSWEIHHFLQLEKIKTIEAAIADNNIDY